MKYQSADGRSDASSCSHRFTDAVLSQVEILARAINKTENEIEKDINRPKYFDAWGAKEYGIIDKVLASFVNLLS